MHLGVLYHCFKSVIHCCILFLFVSVLGTFAATYLTAAMIIKYHTMQDQETPVTPIYSSGWVNMGSYFLVETQFTLTFACIVMFNLYRLYSFVVVARGGSTLDQASYKDMQTWDKWYNFWIITFLTDQYGKENLLKWNVLTKTCRQD